jgi:hypothetical protein
MDDKCVHTEHCCLKHGCKYGDDDCPVESGAKLQSFDCEACYEEKGGHNFLRITTLETENAQLRAELAALREQEPVAYPSDLSQLLREAAGQLEDFEDSYGAGMYDNTYAPELEAAADQLDAAPKPAIPEGWTRRAWLAYSGKQRKQEGK